MQPKRVRKLRSLARGVGLSKTQAQPITDLRVRKLKGLACALRDLQGDNVLPKPQNGVHDVVANVFTRGLDTAQELQAIPEEHVLRAAHLPPFRSRTEKAWSDSWGTECFVELPVQEHPPPMTDDQILESWTLEPTHGASSLQHFGQRLEESISSLDQRAVEVEQLHIAPVSLGQGESVP